MQFILIVKVTFLLLFLQSQVWADSVMPAGGIAKSYAVGSALVSGDSAAVLYNPAGLNSTEQDFSIEAGMVHVQTKYKSPDFDPVSVKFTSPIGSAGIVGSWGQKWNAGFIFHPKNNSKMKISGLPRRVAGYVTPLAADIEERAGDLGAGISRHFFQKRLSVGASAISQHEYKKGKIQTNEMPDALLEYKLNHHSIRTVAGLRGQWKGILAAVSYSPAAIKKYKGRQDLFYNEEGGDPTYKNYSPEVQSYGLGLKLGQINLEGSYIKRAFSAGREDIKTLIAARDTDDTADLNNVVETGWKISYQPHLNFQASIANASLPTPWGDGRFDGNVDRYQSGVEFGAIDAVSYNVWSVGCSWENLFGLGANLTAYQAKGQRTVGSGGDNIGSYETNIVTLVSGVKKEL